MMQLKVNAAAAMPKIAIILNGRVSSWDEVERLCVEIEEHMKKVRKSAMFFKNVGSVGTPPAPPKGA